VVTGPGSVKIVMRKALPFYARAPLVGGLVPATNTPDRNRHRVRNFLAN
jgi:hypothetical protein